MKTKEITTKQYAALYGCSPQNVTKLIRNNRKLPKVIRIKQLARDYIIVVPADLSKDDF